MGHYETLRTEKFGTNHDLYLALKAKLMHKKSTEEVTIIGIPPITIISNGNNATVGLKGNEEHSGTPTHDNPIMPQGTGERTGNLFDKDNADTYQAYFPTTDYWVATDSDSISVKMPCKANTQYTLSIPISESGSIFRIYEGNDINAVPALTNPPMLTRIIRAETTKTYTFTTSATTECIVFQGAYTQRNVWLNGLMFNEGEYKPLEPYGYKLDISSGGTTTPIYLGEVETTRKVKKLVLDGTEAWEDVSILSQDTYRYRVSISDTAKNGSVVTAISSHYNYYYGSAGVGFNFASSGSQLYIRDANCATVSDFKSYLAAQYAAGTPVTVWYALATPETAVVNEPLMKIGDYADEISGITIPTTKGINVVDVDTEVKPSEISITYTKGKEISINNISDMENLTIADLEKMTIAELEG